MKKYLLIVLVVVFSNLTFGQRDSNPFLNLKTDGVVFYDFGGDPGEEVISIIETNGRLSHSVIKSAKLDKVTAYNFTKLLGQKNSYGSGTAACFEPHLGVVYYSNKKAIAYLNICLSCNRLYSSIELPNQLQGKQGEGKDTYYILEGMSKRFRKDINALLITYQFSHQLRGKSMFDE